MVRLADAPDTELRMTQLAEDVVTSKSGLTYQISKMEKAGLVRRRSCPSDDRGVYAVLTEHGRQRLEQAAPGHVDVVRSCLIDLLDREQLDSLADGLTTVTRRLRAGEDATADSTSEPQ